MTVMHTSNDRTMRDSLGLTDFALQALALANGIGTLLESSFLLMFLFLLTVRSIYPIDIYCR